MVLGQIFRQIGPIRVKTLINSNVVASRHIKREEILVPVAARHSKTPELNFNFIRGNENVTHSAKGETAFLGEIFCLEYPSRRTEKGNVSFANYIFSFSKLQIFISQTIDSHFANYRFSCRKLQIFISFPFVSFWLYIILYPARPRGIIVNIYIIPLSRTEEVRINSCHCDPSPTPTDSQQSDGFLCTKSLAN